MMGAIGIPELLIILAIVIVVFGPARLAGVGKTLGQAIRTFRSAVHADGKPSPKHSADLADNERV